MAETATIARPYAQAVFKLAQERGDLKAWSDRLAFAAAVASEPAMSALIKNPQVRREQLAGLFIDICGHRLDDHGKNFMRLLAENRRLASLPEISALFETLRAQAESTIEAELVSAMPTDTQQSDRIAAALKARLGREVTLKCTTDPSLLGGAVIRAGDLVIDGSVRGRLVKLAGVLTQ